MSSGLKLNAVACITAVPTRKEHIESHIIPALEKYGVRVFVNYDTEYYNTDRDDGKQTLRNASANSIKSYDIAFNARQGNELVMTLTDDVVLAEDWGDRFYKIWQVTKGCEVYCLYTAFKGDLEHVGNPQGYFVDRQQTAFRDQFVIHDFPEGFNPMALFPDREVKGSRFISFELRWGRYLKRIKASVIVTLPTLVDHINKSEIFTGKPRWDNKSLDFVGDKDENK